MPAMAEDILSHNHRAPYKTRSSSISAPPSSSLEAIICQQPIDNGNNSENSTPDYRRRKPAARSQSARITGVRSVRVNSSLALIDLWTLISSLRYGKKFHKYNRI